MIRFWSSSFSVQSGERENRNRQEFTVKEGSEKEWIESSDLKDFQGQDQDYYLFTEWKKEKGRSSSTKERVEDMKPSLRGERSQTLDEKRKGRGLRVLDMNQEISIIQYTSMKMWRKGCQNYQKMFQFCYIEEEMKFDCCKFWVGYNLE